MHRDGTSDRKECGSHGESCGGSCSKPQAVPSIISQEQVLISKCSHGDVACDELREDQRCAKCHSVPGSYQVGDEEYCWLHRERLSSKYPVSANFLFRVYSWRGHESIFPNAKLYEVAGEQNDVMVAFCSMCQEVYERWLAGSCYSG